MSNDMMKLTDELNEVLEPAEVLDSQAFIQPPLPNVEDYDLTPLQLKAAQAVMINDMTLKKKGAKRKPYKQIAADLGIDEDTLIRYRALPEFQRFVRDAMRLSVSSSIPMAITRLTQLADGSITGTPSIRAIEMLLEMDGMYSKSTKHEINVKQPPMTAQVSDEELARIIERADADIIEMADIDNAKDSEDTTE